MTDNQHAPLLIASHDLGDRAAMGLPARLANRLPVESREYLSDLVNTSPEALADIVEDASQSLSRRFFAGQLLALLGDPRINPDMPAMVDIPAAAVHVGLDRQAADSLTERPRHRAHVRAFHMMRYLVTNYEYQRFLADTDYSSLPTSWQLGRYPHERANHPVWSISETAASLYASWLSQRLRRRFRLPTEAEWEYAASGGGDRKYPWGNIFHPDAANTIETGPLSTTPVGMYPVGRSPFGIDDLAGNVEELVTDDPAPYPGVRRRRRQPMIALWAALVVALTAATYSVTWDLCNTGDGKLEDPTIEDWRLL